MIERTGTLQLLECAHSTSTSTQNVKTQKHTKIRSRALKTGSTQHAVSLRRTNKDRKADTEAEAKSRGRVAPLDEQLADVGVAAGGRGVQRRPELRVGRVH